MTNIGHDSEIYSWFENSGIIAKMRTNLRQKLVNALRNRTPRFDNDIPRSAKQYVYDLLIADYLLSYNYAYTLSVFASEAPLLINFPKQTQLSSSDTVRNDKHALPRDYICHTLQTLGINPDKRDGKEILSSYANDGLPLILCILRYLTSKSTNDDSNRPSCCNQQTQTSDVYSPGFCDSISLLEAKKKLYHQKELFNAQLKNKEIELKEQAAKLEQQLSVLNDKLQQAQNLMYSVDLKEKRLIEDHRRKDQILARKELELSAKERQLSLEADRLQKEKDSSRKFEEDMEKLKEELAKVKNDISCKRPDTFVSIKQSVSVQTDDVDSVNIFLDMDLLTQEKQDLTSLVREQQLRIEELTLRVVTLSRRLEEVSILKSPIAETVDIIRPAKFNTIFSESSSTEDILHDAKMRLKRLEEESLRADQYYYSCLTSP